MIKIVIFEDNHSRRTGLMLLLNSMENLKCVGAYSDCSNVIHDINQSNPDVVLMDINMPNVNGLEGLKLIKEHFPHIKVVMLTIFEEEDKILEAICAKADGYLLKQKSPMKLIEGIQEVMEGGAPMTPSVARKVLTLFNNPVKKKSIISFNLTKREVEILSLLVEGYSYKIIADKCFISYATVNKHVSNIYSKMQVNSVAKAVSKAIKEGLV